MKDQHPQLIPPRMPGPPPRAVLGFVPSGSPVGKPNAVDATRTAIAGFSVYGALQSLQHFLVFAGAVTPNILPKYGTEIAGIAVAVSTFLMAWLHDNTPRDGTQEAHAVTPPINDRPGE